MNAYLKWYGRTLLLGVVAHVAFAAPALTTPDLFGTLMATGRVEFSAVWLGNMGMLLCTLSLYMLTVARDPARYAPFTWLFVVEKILATAWWLRLVLDPTYGSDYAMLLGVDGVLAVVPLVLLQLGLPPELRLGAILPRAAALLRPPPLANGSLTWFRRLVWLGAAVNATFIIPAIFAQDLLRGMLRSAQYVTFSHLWLVATGLVLLGVTLLYLPAAHAPEERPATAWLLVVSRFIAAAFWLRVTLQPDRQVFASFLISDFTFGVVLLVLLQRGMAPERRISVANLRALLAEGIDALLLRGKPLAVRLGGAALALALAFVGYNAWYYLMRATPDPRYDSPEEHFKYGAIGVGMSSRIPYWLFAVMPDVCPDKLPDARRGWASFGLLFEPGKDVPVGFARREIGYPSVEGNCALCHSGSYRPAGGAAPVIVPGAPAHELDLQGFQWFLYDCASDPRFNADTILAEIGKRTRLGPIESLFYRYAIIPMAKSGLLRQQREYAWQHSRPTQGRGRTDTFNPTKINVFFMKDDGSIGTTDLPQIWNQAPRSKLWLHWDGNNGDIHERNYAAAMAIGATPDSVIQASFDQVTNYLWTLKPPPYPFPIDRAAAERGQRIYARECARCHAFEGQDVGKVTSASEIGTDPHRLESFTQALVDDFHEIDLPPFKFGSYRKTQGYSNLPIDGIWARAPYLHHGAVPSLRELLLPPERRSQVFYRGYNVYDPVNVGYVSQGPEAERIGFKYDTRVPGNANTGHLYGTQLSDPDRNDLLEFLKTL